MSKIKVRFKSIAEIINSGLEGLKVTMDGTEFRKISFKDCAGQFVNDEMIATIAKGKEIEIDYTEVPEKKFYHDGWAWDVRLVEEFILPKRLVDMRFERVSAPIGTDDCERCAFVDDCSLVDCDCGDGYFVKVSEEEVTA